MNRIIIYVFFLLVFGQLYAQELYKMPVNKQTRWASFENPSAEKGLAAKENNGAKGHAFDKIPAGASLELVHVSGSGIINRIWMTMSDRSPKMLRSLRLEMFWDGAEKPAVSVPLGDFFGIGLGEKVPFENMLFADPEGRSFNCFIPMPFKTGARIVITNDSDTDLGAIFYDVDMLQVVYDKEELLYFHAFWNRNLKTELGKDFEVLPKVNGKGRFLGTNIGVLTGKIYENTWWGEGEVKMYIDGDTDFPTLAGSGTEDYIGTAYGQGIFSHQYQGCLVADDERGAYAFYRYHIPDPVYFYNNIKVTIQQIGGAPTEKVRELQKNGAELAPVTVDHYPYFTKLLENNDRITLNDEGFPVGWTNFYRRDDVSATAYFYLNRPESSLPVLQNTEIRVAEMGLE